MSEGSHALLSASGSHKWLHCTPSARLEQTLPDPGSTFAEEGTHAHKIAELKLRKQFIEPMNMRTFTAALKKLQKDPLYQEEMLRHTDTYLDYIQGIVHSFTTTPYVAIEKRLDYSQYVPEGYGTGDCVIISGNTLHIIDLKYGKGVPVYAQDNPQMKLYALGAYLAYSILFAIDTVKMAIVQPRLDSISEQSIAVEDLLAWADTITPLAQKAFVGLGEFVPGDHCRFCLAKATCRARADENLALMDEFGLAKPPLLTNEEVAEILVRGQNLPAWFKHLQEFALTTVLSGGDIPGWKAVEGRGSRQFIDQDAAFVHLIAVGAAEEVMLYERKPLTPPGVETLLGKPKFKELLSEHVKSVSGKPTLAPVSDKREAVTRTSAADDFNTPEEEA